MPHITTRTHKRIPKNITINPQNKYIYDAIKKGASSSSIQASPGARIRLCNNSSNRNIPPFILKLAVYSALFQCAMSSCTPPSRPTFSSSPHHRRSANRPYEDASISKNCTVPSDPQHPINASFFNSPNNHYASLSSTQSQINSTQIGQISTTSHEYHSGSLTSNNTTENFKSFIKNTVCDDKVPETIVDNIAQGLVRIPPSDLENFLVTTVHHSLKNTSKLISTQGHENLSSHTQGQYLGSKDQIILAPNHPSNQRTECAPEHFSGLSVHETLHKAYREYHEGRWNDLPKHLLDQTIHLSRENVTQELVNELMTEYFSADMAKVQECKQTFDQYIYCLNSLLYEYEHHPENPKLQLLEDTIKKGCTSYAWNERLTKKEDFSLRASVIKQLARFSLYHEQYAPHKGYPQDSVCNELLAEKINFNPNVLNELSKNFYRPEQKDTIANYTKTDGYQELIKKEGGYNITTVYQADINHIQKTNNSELFIANKMDHQAQRYYDYLKESLPEAERSRIKTMMNQINGAREEEPPHNKHEFTTTSTKVALGALISFIGLLVWKISCRGNYQEVPTVPV
jgi:hypothetical protein